MPEHAAVRTRTAPVHPRRVSGPSRRLAPARPIPRGRTGAFERISRIPDHRVVDRVLRSRGCICRAVVTQSTLEKQNMALQSAIAQLTSGERVTAAAAGGQMIDPPAGQTRYVTAHAKTDPARAARRYKPPSERAIAITDNNGALPGSLAPPGSAAGQLAASLNEGAAAVGATPNATPTATPQATPPAATPTPVVTPVPTPTTSPVTTDPATGAATAPEG
jgi:hypothetical protein